MFLPICIGNRLIMTHFISHIDVIFEKPYTTSLGLIQKIYYVRLASLPYLRSYS